MCPIHSDPQVSAGAAWVSLCAAASAAASFGGLSAPGRLEACLGVPPSRMMLLRIERLLPPDPFPFIEEGLGELADHP